MSCRLSAVPARPTSPLASAQGHQTCSVPGFPPGNPRPALLHGQPSSEQGKVKRQDLTPMSGIGPKWVRNHVRCDSRITSAERQGRRLSSCFSIHYSLLPLTPLPSSLGGSESQFGLQHEREHEIENERQNQKQSERQFSEQQQRQFA